MEMILINNDDKISKEGIKTFNFFFHDSWAYLNQIYPV